MRCAAEADANAAAQVEHSQSQIPAPLSPVVPLRPIIRSNSGVDRSSSVNVPAVSPAPTTPVRQQLNVPVQVASEYVRPSTDVSHAVQLQPIGPAPPSHPVVSTQHLNLRPERPGMIVKFFDICCIACLVSLFFTYMRWR